MAGVYWLSPCLTGSGNDIMVAIIQHTIHSSGWVWTKKCGRLTCTVRSIQPLRLLILQTSIQTWLKYGRFSIGRCGLDLYQRRHVGASIPGRSELFGVFVLRRPRRTRKLNWLIWRAVSIWVVIIVDRHRSKSHHLAPYCIGCAGTDWWVAVS